MAGKKGTVPKNKKIMDDQRAEICRLFYDEGWKQKDLSARFGVSQGTISDIVNHPDCLVKMLKRTTAEKVRAQIKINHHLLEAVDKQIELMRGEYDPQYRYLNQNAARDILDRGGVRAEKEENNELQVNVNIGGGMKLGVPDHSQDNSQDNDAEELEEETEAE